ncbi:MAG: hypothetical protein K9L66_11530 [Spirochaetaceae bacterium]|nr:hypothetical protein [Spirochaetaceae bacterium]MCF7939747.1 hypothetical protein [Spirochaetales bacterium]
MARKGKKQKKGGCLKGILPVIVLGLVGVSTYYTYIMEVDTEKEGRTGGKIIDFTGNIG